MGIYSNSAARPPRPGSYAVDAWRFRGARAGGQCVGAGPNSGNPPSSGSDPAGGAGPPSHLSWIPLFSSGSPWPAPPRRA
jgi:hypothetical protein